eukprot:5123694-Prymnesium_polylepis.1
MFIAILSEAHASVRRRRRRATDARCGCGGAPIQRHALRWSRRWSSAQTWRATRSSRRCARAGAGGCAR